MDDDKLDRVIALLEDISAKLGGRKLPLRTPAVAIDPATARETMTLAHAGKMVTIADARSTLNLHGASNKAISQLLMACGFERRRGAAGVKFAVAAPPGKVGRPLELPPISDDAIAAARARPQPFTARQFLHICQRQGGSVIRLTAAHENELRNRYPGVFADPV